MRSIMIWALLLSSGVSAMPEESLREFQSEELRQAYRENPSQDLQQLTMSEEMREQMLQQALFYAGRTMPVDNRAYLIALAVDLYHSLPPGPDPSGYESGELGGKGDLMRQFQKWSGMDQRGMEPDRDREWEILLSTHEGKPDNLVAAIEIKYIRHYFQEHIQLDDFIEHARLDAQDLSFSNPTHYAALQTYMQTMQHRIRTGVPPWEETNHTDDGREIVPAATAPARTAEPSATPVPEKTGMSSLMKLATGALLLVAIAAFMISRRRRE